jgi:hypothetical protein
MQYNKIVTRKVIPLKRNLTMDDLNKYIDICLIDEYANKSFEDGYTLDLDDLPDHEISNFLDRLMQEDTTVRDLVRYHMQQMIDARLPECEVEDRSRAGISLVQLSNGDSYLQYPRGESSW